MAMQPVEQYNTLECVSNDVGGDLISTAKWTGVKLEDILQPGAGSAAGHLRGLQGHRRLQRRDTDGEGHGLDGTILAYEMNGEPLPAGARVPRPAIVPGYYGMMNASG